MKPLGFRNAYLDVTMGTMLFWMTLGLSLSSSLLAKPYTIVAFGDSTTAPRGPLQIYPDLLRMEVPKWGIEVKVINAGVPGDSTADARARFDRDVLAAKPDLVIIQFGINDSSMDVYKVPQPTRPRVSREEYAMNLQYFVTTLGQRNIKTILMTPNPQRWTAALKQLYGKPPYQLGSADGLNVLLKDYVEIVRQIARRDRVVLVDVYAAFDSYEQQTNKSMEDLLLDGMHPNNDGHRLIASLLLPQVVTSLH